MGRTEWTIIIGTLVPLKIDVESLRRKMAAPAVAQDLEIIKVERVEDLLSCILVGDGRLNDFLGSGQTLNTDDFPYLEYIAPRSAFGSSREGLAPPFIPNSSVAGKMCAPIFKTLPTPRLKAFNNPTPPPRWS